MTSYQEADGAADGGIKGFRRFTSCLIPLIAAIVLLALGVTTINYFIEADSNGGGVSATDAGPGADASSSPGDDGPAGEPSRSQKQFSDEGILALLTGLGWTRYGELAHYQLGGRTRQTRKFRKNGARISVTIHSFKSQRVARKEADTVARPANRVRFDHKIVVIEGLDAAGTSEIPHLIERLEAYRDMVRD